MRFTELFTHTLKEAPKDEVSINAQLLERAGFVRKIMSGAYAYLPIGWRVFGKIKNIIKEEMDNLGAQEVQFTALQPKELWEKSGRWELLGKKEKVMYQFQDYSGHDIGLASTHEEPMTEIAKDFFSSYKDLPKAIYQFQKKFRAEARAKSGLVRLREFTMKDLYSFHASENDLKEYYQKVIDAYAKIFKRCGLNAFVIEASGGIFTENISHEFQVLSPYGEDTILYCAECHFAQNKEIAKLSEGDECPKCKKSLSWATGVEVGNIFNNGTKYSKDLGLEYKNSSGESQLVWMGSYGIGLDRLLGTIVDVHNDQKGIIWPHEVAPFSVHLINLDADSSHGERIYSLLVKSGIEVLFDDRTELSAGAKFADADLLGIPFRFVFNGSKMKEDEVEVKERNKDSMKVFSLKQAMNMIQEKVI